MINLQFSSSPGVAAGFRVPGEINKASPLLGFPKYNNYMLDRNKFDTNSKVLVPLNLLGIRPLEEGKVLFVYIKISCSF